jgi:hypothetical protein
MNQQISAISGEGLLPPEQKGPHKTESPIILSLLKHNPLLMPFNNREEPLETYPNGAEAIVICGWSKTNKFLLVPVALCPGWVVLADLVSFVEVVKAAACVGAFCPCFEQIPTYPKPTILSHNPCIVG